MSHVFFLLPDMNYTGAAKQASLLAPGLAGAGWNVTVFPLAGDGPFASGFRASHIGVLSSTARHAFKWLGLRRLVPSPDRGLVHAFGLPILRRLWGATLGLPRPKIVVSLTGRECISRFDHRCLRLVSRILVPHPAAAQALARKGVSSRVVTVVPPAFAGAPPPPYRDDFCRTFGIPSDARLLMTAGRMETATTLFPAIWAFEFYRYMDPCVRLLVIGEGAGREETEAKARQVAPDGSRVHFLGARPDLSSLFGLADIVLISQRSGGTNIALEAMAAGRALVAADTPDLAGVVRNGITGILTPAGDAPAMAGALRHLLADPERHQLGDAARQFVRANHSVDAVVQTLETIYWN